MAGFNSSFSFGGKLHRTATTHGTSGAVEYGASVRFSVDLPNGAENAKIVFFSDDDGRIFEYKLTDGAFSTQAKALCGEDDGALLFYKFVFSVPSGDFQIVRSKNGLSDTTVDLDDSFENAFQLTVYKKRDVMPEKLVGGIMYQIFPDRFFRGGKEPCRSDAVIDDDWYEGIPPYVKDGESGEGFKNNVFFGGDLFGIVKKLDYIKSLGVTCIYLNPVFEAYSNHKYDTGNYDKIDDMFGGEKAFKKLIKAAGRRGIGIVLDGVFNHTGADSVYFNKYGRYGSGGAYNDKNSPYYRWYNFEEYPDKYESWWGIDILPRVKSDEPTYKAYLFGKNGVIRRRLREGVYGFRLDVADEVSDGFLRDLKAAACAEKPDAYILGEVWEDASNKISYGVRRKYLRGHELDAVMNYPVRKAIIAYLRDGDFAYFVRVVSEIYENYPPETANLLMNLVSSHDTERIITALAGKLPEGMTQDEKAVYKLDENEEKLGVALVKMAYLIACALPGIPCIYYGDEIGMQGYGDPFCRRPYPWGKENGELLDFYKKMGAVRTKNRDIFSGEMRLVFADADVLCIERKSGGKRLCAVINRSADEYVYSSRAESEELITGGKGRDHEIPPTSCALICSADGEEYGVYRKI